MSSGVRLPTFDGGLNSYVRDWGSVWTCPGALGINTAIPLASSLTMEFARRQAAWLAARALGEAIQEFSRREKRLSWLGLTVILGISFSGRPMDAAWGALNKEGGFYVSTNCCASFVFC